MKKITAILAVAVLLSGCAASRGFLVGMIGGPPIVDEAAHGELQDGSMESALKIAAHEGLIIGTSMVLWPLAAAYAGAAGIYGAYKFQTVKAK